MMIAGIAKKAAKAVAFAFILLSQPLFLSAQADDGGYKGYLIRQTVFNQGAVTTYLCPGRWVIKTGLVTIIGDEKNDLAVAYTRTTNKYIADTFKRGMTRFLGFRRGDDFDWGPTKKIGHTKWKGEEVDVFERQGRRIDLKVKNDVVVTERELCCPRYKSSTAFSLVAYSLLDIDYRNGLPVQVQRTAHSANPRYCTIRPVIAQETLLIKESTFPASEFSIPKGLTKVKTEIDLFSNDEDTSFDGTVASIRKRAKQINVKVEP